MENSTKLGMNRTGIQMSPFDVKAMKAVVPDLDGPVASPPLSALRDGYLAETDLLGSVPLPGSVTGVIESVKETFIGHQPQVLIDKLGERLAFERAGVRLYEALLAKCVARVDEVPDDMLDTLAAIKEDEVRHFKLVHDAMVSIGADPTAETPCATVTGMEGSGLIKVVTDPRTTIPQSLHAILGAELIDNAGWELLTQLAQNLKQDDLSAQFQQALEQEGEHLLHIKHWLLRFTIADAQSAELKDGRLTH